MLPRMRLRRAIPPALVLATALAAPASAAEVPAQAFDFDFSPATDREDPTGPSRDDDAPLAIAVGDRVTWSFSGQGHTVTSEGAQIDRFGSPFMSSGTFSYVFNRPGRFRYFCEPHRSFMRGTVVVGTDDNNGPRLRNVTTRRSRSAIRRIFTLLDERAVVSLKVARGNRSKTVRRVFNPGRRSLRVGGLRRGTRYRTTLLARDGFANRSNAVSARIRTRR